MKVGLRKPSIKKSIRARTTGKLKRTVKRAINPLYGKKGMGYINDPKKAIYNKIYNKTTFGVGDVMKTLSSDSQTSKVQSDSDRMKMLNKRNYEYVCEHFPELAPKSLGGFSKMSNSSSPNYQKLYEAALANGFDFYEE